MANGHGGFRPGGGRPQGSKNKIKSGEELKALAAQHGPMIIDEFAKWFIQGDVDTANKIKIGQELLSRGYGRPVQQNNLAGHDGGPLDLSLMSDEQLSVLAARLASGIKDK